MRDIVVILAIVLIGLLFLSFFKIKHSMTFLNLDELLWMQRSRFFIDRILTFDFSNLIQSSQPGITVMWLTGPFMKMVDYESINSISSLLKNLNDAGIPYNIINDYNPQLYLKYSKMSFLFNLPVLGIIFVFLFSLYYLLQKVGFNRWAIIFSLLLIVTTPYYIYFTTPTDKLVGIFSTLSILSLLVYASKEGKKKFLILSAVLCALAVLAKLSALFLVLFSFFVLVFYRWEYSAFRHLKIAIEDYLICLAVFFATSVTLLPTIITDPYSIISFFAKENSQRIIVASSKGYDIFLNVKIMLTYLSDSFILSFNLFVIAIFIAFLFLILKDVLGNERLNGAKKEAVANKEIITLAVYCFSFFVFITFFSKIYSFRYLVPALIVFQVIAGAGIYEFSSVLARKMRGIKKTEVYVWVVVLLLISQALLIYYSKVEKIENLPYFG